MSVAVDELRGGFLRLLEAHATPPVPVAAESQPPGPAAENVVCQTVDPRARGYNLNVALLPSQVVAAAEFLDAHGFAIDTVTGVDWLAAGQMEVVYDYFHPSEQMRVAVRTRVPRSQPELPTISRVFPGANWHERETHEFFGIRFLGHPDLSPLLLPEDADYHPLRKDFPGAA